MGLLLKFEDGLNPRTGSTFSARSSSISPIDFMLVAKNWGYNSIVMISFRYCYNIVVTGANW